MPASRRRQASRCQAPGFCESEITLSRDVTVIRPAALASPADGRPAWSWSRRRNGHRRTSSRQACETCSATGGRSAAPPRRPPTSSSGTAGPGRATAQPTSTRAHVASAGSSPKGASPPDAGAHLDDYTCASWLRSLRRVGVERCCVGRGGNRLRVRTGGRGVPTARRCSPARAAAARRGRPGRARSDHPSGWCRTRGPGRCGDSWSALGWKPADRA